MKTKTFYAILFAITLGVVYFLLLFSNLQRQLDHDQVVYTNNIRSFFVGKQFVNPHHLHFEPTGFYFHKFLTQNFPDYLGTNLMFHLRIRSLLFAAIGISACFLYLYLLTRKYLVAFIASFAIGFQHGYLSYAAKNDTGIYPASWLFVMLLAGLALYHSRYSIYFSCFAGLVLFAGVMFHEYMVGSCIALFIGLLLPDSIFQLKIPTAFERIKLRESKIEVSLLRRYVSLLFLFLFCFIPTAWVYLWGGRVVWQLEYNEALYSFQNWIFGYLVGSPYGRAITKYIPEYSMRGFTDAFFARTDGIQYNAYTDFQFQLTSFTNRVEVTHTLLPSMILVFLLILIFFFFKLTRFYGRTFFILILHFLFFLFIGIDIEPHYFEFWIIPALLFTVFFALFWNYLAEQAKEYFVLAPIRTLAGVGLFISALLVSVHNYQYELILHSRNFKTEGVYGKIGETPIEYFKSSVNYKYPNDPYKEVDSKLTTTDLH